MYRAQDRKLTIFLGDYILQSEDDVTTLEDLKKARRKPMEQVHWMDQLARPVQRPHWRRVKA